MPLSSAQALGTTSRRRLSQIGDVEECTACASSYCSELLNPVTVVQSEDGADVGEEADGRGGIGAVIAPSDLRGFHCDDDLLRGKSVGAVATYIRGREANRRRGNGDLIERDRRELTDGLGHRLCQEISNRLVERPLNRFDLLEKRTPRLKELGE